MINKILNNLIVLELANNHMGSVSHAKKIIDAFAEICFQTKYKKFNFAFKIQLRNFDTFIHKKYKKRNDLSYIKRFNETMLSDSDFIKIIKHIKTKGFYSMATPFDNESIPLANKLKIDIIKIASCSFDDWPLLEEVVLLDKPVVISSAGSSKEDIDNVISFFINREKYFALLHCVAEYPTQRKNLNIGQIDYFKSRYPNIIIGFSTHEEPDNFDAVKIAIAKGASVLEKHVGLETSKYKLNKYSVGPKEFQLWLNAIRDSIDLIGKSDVRYKPSKQEISTLNSLQRGVFLKKSLPNKTLLTNELIYFAFPAQPDQLKARDFSKYTNLYLKKSLKKDEPVFSRDIKQENNRDLISKIENELVILLKTAKITIPSPIDVEISHHYGINNFYKYGMCIITIINRGYCKKLLILFPGQKHPEQFHKRKEETFRLIYGDVNLILNNKDINLKLSDVVTILPNSKHAFSTKKGAVIEEISSTHFINDSYYSDYKINSNKERKTIIKLYLDN